MSTQKISDPRTAAEMQEAQRAMMLLKSKKELLMRQKQTLLREKQFAQTLQEGKGESERRLAETSLERAKSEVESKRRQLEREKEEVITDQRMLERLRRTEEELKGTLSRSKERVATKEDNLKEIRKQRLAMEARRTELERAVEGLDHEKERIPHGDDKVALSRIDQDIQKASEQKNELDTKVRALVDEEQRLENEASEFRRHSKELHEEVGHLREAIERLTNDLHQKQTEATRAEGEAIAREEAKKQGERHVTIMKQELEKELRAEAQLRQMRDRETKALEVKKARFEELSRSTTARHAELEHLRSELGQYAIKEAAAGRGDENEERALRTKAQEAENRVLELHRAQKKDEDDVRNANDAFEHSKNELRLRENDLKKKEEAVALGKKKLAEYEAKLHNLAREEGEVDAQMKTLEQKIEQLKRAKVAN